MISENIYKGRIGDSDSLQERSPDFRIRTLTLRFSYCLREPEIGRIYPGSTDDKEVIQQFFFVVDRFTACLHIEDPGSRFGRDDMPCRDIPLTRAFEPG